MVVGVQNVDAWSIGPSWCIRHGKRFATALDLFSSGVNESIGCDIVVGLICSFQVVKEGDASRRVKSSKGDRLILSHAQSVKMGSSVSVGNMNLKLPYKLELWSHFS